MTDNDKHGSEDLDPAVPTESAQAPDTGAIERANMGADGRGDIPDSERAQESTEAFGRPALLKIDIAAAHAFLKACMTSHPRVTYGLGAKIKPGQVPGRDFTKVDCSGFVREAMRRSTDLGNKFPDGSVVQHDWVKARGFDKLDRAAGSEHDGAVRIAFLEPKDSPKRIGHVILLHNGTSLESHGGVGPDERPWTGAGWQAKAHVYLLAKADAPSS